MVDFVQLQHIMKEQLDQDRDISIIEAQGPTLEEAVAQAATLLNLPVRRIEYEISERGSTGIMGAGKKDWKIKAYRHYVRDEKSSEDDSFDSGVDFEVPVMEDKNGYVFVHLRHDGVYIKVSSPVGRGKKATPAQARVALADRGIKDFDQTVINEVIKNPSDEYIRVGDFEHKPSNDATMTVEIAEQDMKALLYVTPPGPGGCDVSIETYQTFLKNNKVYFGIDLDYLRDFADQPVYKQKVVIAEGLPPTNGRDAYLQYNFETNQSKVHIREGANGRVDFKDLKLIQNVFEAQPLAKKIPPEQGTPGRTVTGNPLPARDGKDMVLPLGKNVHMGEDKVTIIADMNGQVVEVNGKINVEPVYTVDGDVDLKTGNIIFLGTVMITGNVVDGFSVKAAGNIEVNGTVEKADLDAEGDIIVHQGVTGRGKEIIRAGKTLMARFIENTMIEAGDSVIASDGIINSRVDAGKRIICQGKRATIVGGRLRAGEEINAKILGSPTAGTETICEVGVDPKTKELLSQLAEKKATLEKQFDDIKLNIQTLINIKQQRKSLPEDKEAYLQELDEKRVETITDIKKNTDDIEKAQDLLNNLQARGRVSASAKVYPGVRVMIKDAKEDVRTEYRAVTFILEDGLVKITKYEEPDMEGMRGLDGN
ncbi:FapA family protein [Treponema primitia]|uniref:FapA family protein n=1 Tax=Treponema primitia TaxID=88058 RepID=UPI0039815BCB